MIDLSLANIIGYFLASLLSGIVGAIVLNLIDRYIAKKLKSNIVKEQINKNNKILKQQNELILVHKMHNEQVKRNVAESISNRHEEAAEIIKDVVEKITNYNIDDKVHNKKEVKSDNEEEFDEMNKMLKNLGM